MAVSGIHGLPLEVTVVGCHNLDDKEWISRQDPYVFVEYGSEKFRTKTCTDGGKNPTFQEKFVFKLVEGLQELNVVVWNSHSFSADELIGTGRIQLHKALSQGFDDASWPLQNKRGRHSGEVRLILHFPNANQHSKSKVAPSVPTYATSSAAMSQVLPYGSSSPAPTSYQTHPIPAPSAPLLPSAPNPASVFQSAPIAYAAYPTNSATYPPSPYPPTPPAGYPPPQTQPTQAYPPAGYPPQMQPTQAYPPSGYPPQTHPTQGYPPAGYPPQTQACPPVSQAPTCYPPGTPSGIWPPPPSCTDIYPPPPYY